MLSLTDQIKENPDDLARLIRLQKMLKARLMTKTLHSHLSTYPWLIGGNEPDIKPQAIFKDGKFALVGCGVLRSIEAAFSLIDKEAYQPSDDAYGYKNVPKLYVVDMSTHVQTAWQRLKKICIESKNLSDLKQRLLQNDLYKGLRTSGWKYDAIERLESFCKSDQDFTLFKQIVAKASFILGDWADEKPLAFVKERTADMPVAIYASNILEVEVRCTEEDKSQVINEVVARLMSLNPVMTIYANTSATYCKEHDALHPSRILMQKGADIDKHLQAIRQFGNSYLAEFIPEKQEPYLKGFSGFFNRKPKPNKVTLKKCPNNGSPNSNLTFGFKPGFLEQLTPTTMCEKEEQPFAGLKGGFLNKKRTKPEKKVDEVKSKKPTIKSQDKDDVYTNTVGMFVMLSLSKENTATQRSEVEEMFADLPRGFLNTKCSEEPSTKEKGGALRK